MYRPLCVVLYFFTCVSPFIAQINVEGYVFEKSNRGFIQNAQVAIFYPNEEQSIIVTETDNNGRYQAVLPESGIFEIVILREPFISHSELIKVENLPKVYIKHEVTRLSGYIFEITLAEKNPEPGTPKDALKGALVEVFNNTTIREELIIEDYQGPDFRINLIKGNHYTIMVRKEGYISKRLEAYVDVAGCILCFEGLGSMKPGVNENLSEENSIGTLIANIEMDRIYEGKTIGVENIYYRLNSAELTTEAKNELKKLSAFIKDNPGINVELGSHTDSRGRQDYNQKLSEDRAKSAVNYLVNSLGISSNRVSAKGYGASKIINECKSGVICSEERHAVNRRTELKVLDVIMSEQHRYLRQIKADELLEDMIAGVSKLEQIRIPIGENLDRQSTDEMSGTEKGRFFERVDSEENNNGIDTSENSRDVTTAPLHELKNTVNVSEPSTSLIKDEPTPITHDKDKQKGRDEATAPSVTDSLRGDQERQTPGQEPFASLQSNVLTNKDLTGYTGFKIVLMFSRYPLVETHPIFKEKGKLLQYATADHINLYMIGDYQSLTEARKEMADNFLKRYPSAYVVGFTNGARTY